MIQKLRKKMKRLGYTLLEIEFEVRECKKQATQVAVAGSCY